MYLPSPVLTRTSQKSFQTPTLTLKFSKTPGVVDGGAPIYGQHTLSVLAEYNFSADEIEEMIKKGAVVAA